MSNMRRVARMLIGLDVSLILGTLLLADGQSVGRPGSLPYVTALAGWWSLPSVVLLVMRTRTGLAIAAALLLPGSAAALVSIYADPSSTAVLGYVTVPMLRLAVGATCRAVEALTLSFLRPRSG